MATAPANDAGAPVVASEIILLDPNDIEITARLRDIDLAWAEAIGSSMARDGQIHAIHVCAKPEGGWRLAGPGGHRTTGARLAGIAIEAKIVSPNEASQRRREAAENIFRRPNDPVERAAAVAELVRLHREKAGLAEAVRREASVPKSRASTIREEAEMTLETISNVYGFTREVGAQLGLSDRTIRNDLSIYRSISPSLIARLRASRKEVAQNASQLRALAKLESGEQQQVVDHLTGARGDDPAKSVADALGRMRGSNRLTSDPTAKNLSAFISAFSRMSLTEKKGALHELAALLPAGIEISFDRPSRAPDPSAVQLADLAPRALAQACDIATGGSPELVPAVPIRRSVKADHLVCLECGEHHKMLKRHLASHGLTPAAYLQRWKLPVDYPFVAPDYAEERRQLAKKLGLGARKAPARDTRDPLNGDDA